MRKKVTDYDTLVKSFKDVLIPLLGFDDPSITKTSLKHKINNLENEIEKLRPVITTGKGYMFNFTQTMYFKLPVNDESELKEKFSTDFYLVCSGIMRFVNKDGVIEEDTAYFALSFPEGFAFMNGSISPIVIASNTVAFDKLHTINAGMSRNNDGYYIWIKMPDKDDIYQFEVRYWFKSEVTGVTFTTIDDVDPSGDHYPLDIEYYLANPDGSYPADPTELVHLKLESSGTENAADYAKKIIGYQYDSTNPDAVNTVELELNVLKILKLYYKLSPTRARSYGSFGIAASRANVMYTIFEFRDIILGTTPYFKGVEDPDSIVRSEEVRIIKALEQAEYDKLLEDKQTVETTEYHVFEDYPDDPTIPPSEIPSSTTVSLVVKYNDIIVFTNIYPINQVVTADMVKVPTITGYRFDDLYDSLQGGSPVTFPITMTESRVLYARYNQIQYYTCEVLEGSSVVVSQQMESGSAWNPVIPMREGFVPFLYTNSSLTTPANLPITISGVTRIYVNYIKGYYFMHRDDYNSRIDGILAANANDLSGYTFMFPDEETNALYQMFQGRNVVQLPDKIIARGSTDASGFASNVTTLKSILTDLFTNTGVNNFTTAFYGCTQLTGNAPEYWNIPDAKGAECFAGCTGLNNFYDIPESWGGLKTYTFADKADFDSRITTVLQENNYNLSNAVFKFTNGLENENIAFPKGATVYSTPYSIIADKMTSANNLFSPEGRGISTLNTISPALFKGCPQLTSVVDAFKNCTGIRAIPSLLFANNPELTNVSGVFFGCVDVSALPVDLFTAANNPKLSDLSDAFAFMTFKEIPSKLFDGISTITSFKGTFRENKTLVHVPENFLNVTALSGLKDASIMFYNCSSILTNLPILWIAYPTLTNHSGFAYGCTSAPNYPDIPEEWKNDMLLYAFASVDIFIQQIDSIITKHNNDLSEYTFEFPFLFYTTNGVVFPENITKTPKVIKTSYPVVNIEMMFSNCINLTTIAPTLFQELTGVEDISSIFTGCNALREIPQDLFKYNINITSISNAFANCPNLITVPVDLFDTCLKITQAINTFRNCANVTSSIPPLWTRVPMIITEHSDYASGCTSAANYSDVPVDWGGSTTKTLTFTNAADFNSRINTILTENNYDLSDYILKFTNGLENERIKFEVSDGQPGLIRTPKEIQADKCTDITSMFYGCPLEEISPTVFKGMPEITTAESIFTALQGNARDLTIPEDLFKYNTKLQSIQLMFDSIPENINLIVPANLFANNPEITDASYLFYFCDAIREIPSGFLANQTKITTVNNFCENADNLITVPEDLFSSFETSLTTCAAAFIACKSITSNIPAMWNSPNAPDIVASGGNGSYAELTFSAANYADIPVEWGGPTIIFDNAADFSSKIGGILQQKNNDLSNDTLYFRNGLEGETIQFPTSLRYIPRYIGAVKLVDGTKMFFDTYVKSAYAYTLQGCPNLEIADDMFGNCAFSGTCGVTIFNSNKKLKSISGLFADNSSLLELSGAGFDNNPELVNASRVFSGTGYYKIDADLFKYNTKLENLDNIFSGCTRLATVPSNLFDNNPSITSIEHGFSGCAAITSDVPALWTRTPAISGTSCYTGCINATNYADIPAAWK